MKMNKVVLVALLTLAFRLTKAIEGKCERIEEKFRRKTCYMDKAMNINSVGFTISSPKDEAIVALILEGNQNVVYLPEKVAEKFPNLSDYEASSTALTEVFKVNFQNLAQLESLK